MFLMKNYLFVVFVLSPFYFLLGQTNLIYLKNHSFEDQPLAGKPPHSWYYCGSHEESPPDIHPAGRFGVVQSPKEGNTYVGMVVRHNWTWEGLGQFLSQPIRAEQRYRLCLFLCRSEHYESIHRLNFDPYDYVQPVRLRIWGSQLSCEKGELLAQSDAISHSNWQQYCFEFQAKKDYNHLRIEAYFTQTQEAYGGNILVDYASPIFPVQTEIPTLKSFVSANLTELIANIGPIKLDRVELFYDQDRTLHYSSKALWQIAHYLKRHPQKQLTIAIKASSKKQFKKMRQQLTHTLSYLALEEQQFQIYRFRKRHLKDNWIKAADSNLFFREVLLKK